MLHYNVGHVFSPESNFFCTSLEKAEARIVQHFSPETCMYQGTFKTLTKVRINANLLSRWQLNHGLESSWDSICSKISMVRYETFNFYLVTIS